MSHHEFQGMEGLEPRAAFGAIVTVGQKGPQGNPIDKERFFIASTGLDILNPRKMRKKKDPKEKDKVDSSMFNLNHPLDPRFEAFNTLKPGDKRATVLRGNLLFGSIEESFSFHLLARQLGGKGKAPGGGIRDTPPGGIPACTGDGVNARRFNGIDGEGKTQWLAIQCPHDLCYFRQGPQPVCKPFGRLYFRLRWPDGNPLPSILVRYQTASWNTVANMLGLFRTVEATAAGLGFPRESWTFSGLPFNMNVITQRKPEKGRVFPVVKFAVEDVPGFLAWQAKRRELILGAPPVMHLIGDGMAHPEGAPEALAEAVSVVTPGGIPGGDLEPAGQYAPAAPADLVEDYDPPGGIYEPEPPPTLPEDLPDEDVHEQDDAAEEETASSGGDPYRIDPQDPRGTWQRIRETYIEGKGLTERQVRDVCSRMGFPKAEKLPEMFEMPVARALEKLSPAE